MLTIATQATALTCSDGSVDFDEMADLDAEASEILIPIKSFADAKLRLSADLNPADRAALSRIMAERVIAAAAPHPVSVVCDDEEVAGFATEHGASVIWCPERGLNAAVTEGVRRLGARGVSEVVVSHADLPLAKSFDALLGWNGVTLVPDRHMRGTNVAVVPASATFEWSYGVGSLARHRAEALRLGLALRTIRDPNLSWDVDVPEDLLAPNDPDGNYDAIVQQLVPLMERM